MAHHRVMYSRRLGALSCAGAPGRTDLAIFLAMPWAVLAAGTAWADGGFIVEESYTETTEGATQETAALDGDVSSSGQRAVLWLDDDGCWDMYVDPGTISVAGAAWVLPLAVAPSAVLEASPEFIDELDAATLPLLVTEHYHHITYYSTSSSGGGGMGCFGGAASDGTEGGGYEGEETVDEGTDDESLEPPVHVWQQGRIGDVAYSVVSSDEPGALETWLADNEFVIPEGLAEILEGYVAERYYFFVARLVNENGGESRVPVFRFTLCDLLRPSYPIRLSTLSVASELAFTLWLVLPEWEQFYDADNANLESMGSFYEMEYSDAYPAPDFLAQYEERRAEVLAQSRGLALEMATTLDTARIGRRIEVVGATTSGFPLSSDQTTWTDELYDIASGDRRVMRMSGAFARDDMHSDIYFSPGTVTNDTGEYTRTVVSYEERYSSAPAGHSSDEESEESDTVFGDADSCGVSGRHGAGADGRTLPLLILGLVVGLLVFRRRAGR